MRGSRCTGKEKQRDAQFGAKVYATKIMWIEMKTLEVLKRNENARN